MSAARFALLRGLAVVIAAATLSGCVVRLIGAKAGEALSAAILNQSDPELVASGMPAYLLILDGLISQHPENPALLSAGAQLFALYGSRFATPERAVTLSDKARRYGQKSLCLVHAPACSWRNIDYDQLVTIYSHLDSTTTVSKTGGAAPGRSGTAADVGPNNPADFGRPAGPRDNHGRDILFVQDLPDGRTLFTHVFWALPGSPGAPGRP